MPASIGVNLRVTGHCRQGGRKYMEDFFSVAYQQTQDEKDLEYAFFGIFDGHGGMEAATFAKEHLMESIVRQKNFWSDRDEDVLKAIKDGYINTHYAMWREQEKWPKTASGLPSTAGTTASVAFIRRGKIYIGHVGDSGIILGFQEPDNPIWQAKPLTEDHKPENKSEMSRIEQSGGKVVTKSGVPRVVWNRPRIGHRGPVRRSTPIDEIPFLAVARSLGDLWSYNSALDEFVVSPDPDTICIPINADTFRCLIFGTDGLWNMINPANAVNIVQVAEQHNERTVLATTDSQPQETQSPNSPGTPGRTNKVWINPSKCLVERALERWSNTRMRADNTSVITLMLDPPGPPRAEVIKNQRLLENRRQQLLTQPVVSNVPETPEEPGIPEYPKNGLEILTMYEDPPITYPELSANNTENVEPEIPPPVSVSSVSVNNNEQPVDKPDENKLLLKAEKITERRLTEENLNKIHRQILNDIKNNQTELEAPDDGGGGGGGGGGGTSNICVSLIKEPIIQLNEVSSSSSDKSTENENEGENEGGDDACARCTRSQDTKPRKSQRNKGRTSPSPPRRKTRSSVIKAVINKASSSKREHSQAIVEPPQKLRRSQSLGPIRDFTLRSQKSSGERCLRERTVNSLTVLTTTTTTTTVSTTNRSAVNSLVTLSAGSPNSYKKLSTKHLTPVKQAIQTRTRVKRLNK